MGYDNKNCGHQVLKKLEKHTQSHDNGGSIRMPRKSFV